MLVSEWAQKCLPYGIIPKEFHQQKDMKKRHVSYIYVTPESKYDLVLTLDHIQKYVVLNPFYEDNSYLRMYSDLLKNNSEKRNYMTFNENPSTITIKKLKERSSTSELRSDQLIDITDRYVRLFLDLDFNKSDVLFSKSKKEKWLSYICEYVDSLIGWHKVNILTNKNGNYHLIWNVSMHISEIKAVHKLIQDHVRLRFYNNKITSIIDSSVGLRLPYCYKQISATVGKGYNFSDDFYKNDKIEIEWNDPEDTACGMWRYSLYNKSESPTYIVPEDSEIYFAKLYINRFSLIYTPELKQKIANRYGVEGSIDFWLSKNGWIEESLIDLEEWDLEEPISYNQEIILCGKTVTLDNNFMKRVLELVDPKIVNSNKAWYYFMKVFKGFSIANDDPEELYKIFDQWCEEADGYNEENNLRKWNNCKKVFGSIQKILAKLTQDDLEELIGVTIFEQEIYKSQLSIDDNFNVCYNETVNGRPGSTRELDTIDGIEITSANCGQGKTSVCSNFCNKMISEGKSILIITPRINLAKENKLNNPTFSLYLDTKAFDINNEDHLIIQAESLPKIRRTYDIVILDETHELCSQFLSPLHKDYMLVRNTIKKLLDNASMIKMMDAFVSPLIWDFVNNIKGDKLVRSSRNTYKNRSDYTYVFLEEGIEKRIFDAIDNKKKIFVACNSTKFARKIEGYCKDKKIKSVFIWSKSSDWDKTSIITDKNTLEDCQVFIYTPTITVGVSIINLNNPFNEGFCYFNNKTNDANSCMQMTNRVRQLTDKKITFQLNVIEGTLPTNNKDLDILLNKRYIYQHKAIIDTMAQDWSKCEPVLDTNDFWYKHLRAVIKNNNTSNNNFKGLILGYIQETGATISAEVEKVTKENIEVLEKLKGDIENEDWAKYESIPIISEGTYRTLKSCKELSDDEKLQLEVYNHVRLLNKKLLSYTHLKKFKKSEKLIRNIASIPDMIKFMRNEEKRKKDINIEYIKEPKIIKTLVYHNRVKGMMNIDPYVKWKECWGLLCILLNERFTIDIVDDPISNGINLSHMISVVGKRVDDEKWTDLYGKLPTKKDMLCNPAETYRECMRWINCITTQVFGIKLVCLSTLVGKSRKKEYSDQFAFTYSPTMKIFIKNYDIKK